MEYSFKEIERKWQKIWEDKKVYRFSDEDLKNPNKQKYYVLEMLPYPSGKIHMGHVRNYVMGDLLARYRMAQKKTVLHPIGWDAFGLPAENAAMENGVHPKDWTLNNISDMKKALKSIGFSYDWEREIATCLPEYFKHQQKIFLDFLKCGIAYQKESFVNWDPVDKTVLANEQVIDGRGWRSGALVEKKKLRQWFFKVSDFSEGLLNDLDKLDKWPEKVRLMQKNWIGKSDGAEINFQVVDGDLLIKVFSTRPETLFGCSFIAISPNHSISENLALKDSNLKNFIEESNKVAVNEESFATLEKKGYKTQLQVYHPFDPTVKLPVYVANFVLSDYGTGAIFGCPAHDERDFEFASKCGLPVKQVIIPELKSIDRLETDNLVTRPFTEEDVDLIYDLHSDSDVMRYIYSFVNNKDDAKRQISKYIQHQHDYGYSYWAVFEKSSGKFVGKSGLRSFKNDDLKTVEFAVTLHKEFWNKGYGSELVNLWFQQGFENFNLPEIIAIAQTQNYDSRRLLEKFDIPFMGPIKRQNYGGERVYHKLKQGDYFKRKFTPKPYTEKVGRLINSHFLDGLNVNEAKNRLISELENQQKGKLVVSYRLRDWGISRQRYWGCPIPVVYCDDCGVVPVDEASLPIVLPEKFDTSTGFNPLANNNDWRATSCPKCGNKAYRETDTMDTFVDSSWYFLRYISPNLADKPFDEDATSQLMPVNEYIGGIEHAILHLLYARFFCKALVKCGYKGVPNEPFVRLITQGMVCHKTFKDTKTGKWLTPEEASVLTSNEPERVEVGSSIKMSKSKKNVVEPSVIIAKYGVDTVRFFMLSDTPPEKDLEWSDEEVRAVHRFLSRFWDLVIKIKPRYIKNSVLADCKNDKVLYFINPIIKDIYESIDQIIFNKTIAKIRELFNFLSKECDNIDDISLSIVLDILLQFSSLIIPHMVDELWEILGHTTLIKDVNLPEVNVAFLQKNTANIAIQINGKLREVIELPTNSTQEEVQKVVYLNKKLSSLLEGKLIKKTIFVPNKILNIII